MSISNEMPVSLLPLILEYCPVDAATLLDENIAVLITGSSDWNAAELVEFPGTLAYGL